MLAQEGHLNGEVEKEELDIQAEVLKAAADIKFDDMMVIGREADTELVHFYSINREYPFMLWLLESAKLQVMAPQKPLRD